MKYSELVEVYKKLEATQSKLEKTDILAKLFEKLESKELEKVVLLVSGKVFPSYSEYELGIAAQMMIKAISKATGFPPKIIEEKFREKGDLGLVAAECIKSRRQQTLFKKPLVVEKVFENLRNIAYTTGVKSQEKKMNLIAELFAFAEPEEAIYIVRTILEELRVGVGEGLIRDAIVKAFLKPNNMEEKKKFTEVVEYAWNILSDFSEVARIAKESGLKGLKKVKVKLGQPIHLMLGEKAESIKEVIDKFGKVAIEYKYDGMRCISGFTTLYVRNRGLISAREVKVGDEILTHKGRFKKVIAKNIRKREPGERVFKLCSYLGNEFKISEGHKILTNM